ncbi:myosin heavy chain, cardiac muscle isoform-like [Paramacrobiotus metropolitanus]|uniref:myosin heavy chain, cardiac muscle isoform-like n=1 Tax=Paramacrobiotus metropolitanus TaxID=2943436 RepID=UPI002446273F|nr:myosin heavy chain, cardiac muscle isoform-like [Paramacrobiotus metropolitanus]
MKQQQGILENAATEWKIRYERQKEIAEEAQKIADDKEVEKFIAVDELNESMSEESAERSRHLAELKDQCDELRKKANEAELKRNEYASKLAEATQKLATMATEMLKLRNDLKLKEENIGILQKESQAHQKRADEALQVAKELTELGATEGERLKKGIKEVNEENEKLTQESQKWQAQAYRLDTMLEENIRLNTELTAMATTAMLREDEAIGLRNQLRSAAEEYTRMEGEVTQLATMIKKMESDTEKIVQEKTFQLHHHMMKVNLENSDLKREKEEFQLRIKRLEDENKGLQMTNKHKDEQLLQFGVKKTTDESPPPSYNKAQEKGTGGSAHFEMPLRTGGGRGDPKIEKDDEASDKRNPSGSHQPFMSSGDPSQSQQPTETAIKDDGNRDPRSPRHEHDGRYFREYRNERNDRNERDENRAQREFNRSIKNMGRKTDLATFDGNRDAVNGWIRLVKETQRTYELTDEHILIDMASAVRGPAKIWFDGERDIEEAEEEVYTVTEWLNKFRDEYGDRNEEVLGLREAMARKFKPGKETLEQFYQAIM